MLQLIHQINNIIITDPRHPASFLSLPIELRIHIYSYLDQPLQFHIRKYHNWGNRETYTTSICQNSDPSFSQLCAKPPFSAVCPSNTAYHHPPQSPSHALRQTCKLINEELRTFMKPLGLGVTVPLRDGLLYLTTPKWQHRYVAADKITHLTLCSSDPFFAASHIHSAMGQLGECAPHLTALRSVAMQIPLPRHRFCEKRPGTRLRPSFCPEKTWRNVWVVGRLEEIFGRGVTVILEAWVVFRAGKFENKMDGDQMVRVRGVLWGRKDEKKVREVECGVLWIPVVEQEDKLWKEYWKDCGMGYGRQAS
ncbi:hypothetical protein CC86DRAFT_373508 [Ophiobolus disseminans]|uniref:Uncharacterized protein n=1 Tax=Ophiobolus disseminans TaxID=1469910 RepID=A0A6A6ZMT9_9PLEO|nr:hypothetical protein CC86DRAFT_373508 [Ophiobolus disseminans]